MNLAVAGYGFRNLFTPQLMKEQCPMSSGVNSLIGITARFTLFMALVFMLLFVANLRSHFSFHAPLYNSLFVMSIYCAVTGIGLLQHKKWAVLLLFIPGLLSIAVFLYGSAKGNSVPMPWASLNYAFVFVLVAIPLTMLRGWSELNW
jgi:hypothetical protein